MLEIKYNKHFHTHIHNRNTNEAKMFLAKNEKSVGFCKQVKIIRE